MNERIFDPGLAMRLFVLIALLFPLFQCAPLPVEIVDEICSYLNSAALFKLRTVNREFKSQVERYAKRKIKLIPRFGFIRDWQLAQIKNENFGLREQLYSPINSRNHLKLLRFVANYPELRAIYWSLRADVDGFLKPMVKYYERRIHGLDDFVALFNCDHLRENRYNADYYDDWINRELCLVRGFYEYLTRKPSFNILIIGLDSSGKTTLLEQIRRILTNKPVSTETVPTVGLNVSKCDLKGIQCQFWDLGGGGDLPKLWPKYYKESHAVFFVIDSSEFHRDKTKVTSTFVEFVGNEEVEGVPVAVLANKQDLISNQEDSIIEIKEIFNPMMAKIEARESKVFGVSALSGNGVMEALEWMLEAVGKNCDFRAPNFV